MKNNIPKIMKERGLSVSDLSYGARITVNTARRLATSATFDENESIQIRTLRRVCGFLGVGIEEVLILKSDDESVV